MTEDELRLLITAQISQAESAIKEVGDTVEKMAVDFESSGSASSAAMDGVKHAIEGVKRQLMTLHDEGVKIDLHDGMAKAKLDALKADLDTLPREKTVRINSNGGGGAGGGRAMLGAGIMTALPLAAPIAAVGAGAAGGLASAFTSATAGVVAFGAVASGVLTSVFKDSSKITAAQQAYNKAVTSKQKQVALKHLQQAWSGMDKQQLQAVKALRSFESFWKSFTKQFEKPVTQMFTSGLKMLKTILNDMKPVIKGAASAFTNLEQDASKALKSPFWKNFFSFLGSNAKPNIEAFGHILGNVAKGFAGLMEAFNPTAKSMMSGLEGLTKKFANWATHLQNTKGFKDFMEYVKTEGPPVLKLIGHLADIAIQLLKDFSPIGAVLLKVVGHIAGLADKLLKANPALGTLAGFAISAFGAFTLLKGPLSWFFNLDKIIPLVAGLGKALLGMGGDAEVASVGEMMMDALNPVGWIAIAVAAVGALVYIVIKNWSSITKWVSKEWKAIENLAKKVWGDILKFFKKWGLDIVAIILGPIAILALLIYKHWDQIKKFTENLWKNVKKIWKEFVDGTKNIWNGLVKGVEKLWHSFVKGIEKIAKEFVQGIVNSFKWLYNHNYYFKDLVDGIRKLWKDAKKDAEAIWKTITSFLISRWNNLKHNALMVWNAVKNFFSSVWHDISRIARDVWGAISKFFVDLWDREIRGFKRIWHEIRSIASSVWHEIVKIAERVFGPIVRFFSKLWDQVSRNVSKAWNDIKHTIHRLSHDAVKAAEGVFGGMYSKARRWGSNMISGFVDGITSAVNSATGAAKFIMHHIERFFGFHSPAKEGPGQHIVEWGENMIKGFTDGIMNQLPALRTVLSTALTNPLSENAMQVGHTIQHRAMGNIHAGGTVVHNHITVQGSVIHERELTHMVTTGLWDQMKGQGKFSQ